MANRVKRQRKGAAEKNLSTKQYVKTHYEMVRSDAWRSLNGNALKVYFELRTRFNGYNNGQLSLSLKKGAELLGMSQSSVQRALKELEEKGFIKLQKQGMWYGRRASEYAVTDRQLNGVLPTNDWRRSTEKKKPKTVPRYSPEPIGIPDEFTSVPKL